MLSCSWDVLLLHSNIIIIELFIYCIDFWWCRVVGDTHSDQNMRMRYEDVTFFWEKKITVKQLVYERTHSVRDASSSREAGGGTSTTRHVTWAGCDWLTPRRWTSGWPFKTESVPTVEESRTRSHSAAYRCCWGYHAREHLKKKNK